MKWVTLMAKRKLYHLTFLPGLDELGYRYKRAFYKWESGFTDVMATENEVRNKQKELAQIIKMDPFWSEMFTLWAVSKLDMAPNYAKSLYKISFIKLKNKELLSYLKNLHQKMYETAKTIIFLHIDTLMQNSLEDYLIDHIKDKKELLKVIECITAPTKVSANTEQQVDFLKIKSKYHKNKNISEEIEKAIKKHIEEYGWVEMDTGYGRPLTFSEIKIRLFKSPSNNPDNEILKIKKGYKNIKQKREKYFEKYCIPNDIKSIANYLSESTYIRTYRRYSMTKLAWYSKPLHDEIARRLGLGWEELNYLTPWQVYKALNENISTKTLKAWGEENKKFSIGYLGKNRKIIFLTGQKARKFASRQITDDESVGGKVLYGRSVYLGKVRGYAKVVKDSKDLDKVKTGDILVAMQTPPSYIPALKRATGVVVDEGGVTSHASILCREFKIPTIIGTKVATKTYKDGDKLSLDSTLGVVKKI
ncbi:hypothetical protein A2Z67_01530 [Candidatus Woesebacteria bacterium RBG_13_36_22]|uniref:PEP-utilising enzyme mobile domain-containing protein n=1 Tax=Candidatus Woesebacteria bacterium RBG_13_36_22 TaxID=1802478 RepID=A0A1F7WZY6_9BACT|nr:MAG: hypothetical protein A2Z67_01530 [Candidatus Woesebacteria bacterium RBG_13_36_22]